MPEHKTIHLWRGSTRAVTITDETVILNSGGEMVPSAMDHMNDSLAAWGIDAQVREFGGGWVVACLWLGDYLEFVDHMVIERPCVTQFRQRKAEYLVNATAQLGPGRSIDRSRIKREAK